MAIRARARELELEEGWGIDLSPGGPRTVDFHSCPNCRPKSQNFRGVTICAPLDGAEDQILSVIAFWSVKMNIRPDDTIVPEPGDFRAFVDGGELVVAPQLALFAKTNRLSTAEALAGYIHAFPTSLAAALAWRLPDVQVAINRLMQQMLATGALTESDLAAPTPRVHGLGGSRSD